MRFAKWVFTLGGIWGLLIIGPMFFLEGAIARQTEPFTHPDSYYGFLASTIAWQFGYLAIGRDPARFRPFMLIGASGKLIFAGGCWLLYAQGRIPLSVPVIAVPDLVLVVLYVTAWFKTKPAVA
jgi:hypothetical protein